MSNEAMSVPPSVYMSVSPASASVASTGAPMFSPAAVFSATLLAPSSVVGNSGALFASGVVTAPLASTGVDGASFLPVTVMVTVRVSSRAPSLALSPTV